MPSDLFQNSASDFLRKRYERALGLLRGQNPDRLSGPDLAGILDKLADESVVDVPTLNFADRRGRRRKQQREVTDYDRRVVIDEEVIDVSIPIVGVPLGLSL